MGSNGAATALDFAALLKAERQKRRLANNSAQSSNVAVGCVVRAPHVVQNFTLHLMWTFFAHVMENMAARSLNLVHLSILRNIVWIVAYPMCT